MMHTTLLACLAFFSFHHTLFSQSRSISLYFETASSKLSHDESLKLRAFAEDLDSMSIKGLSIMAYCDDRGPASYNKALSVARANTVKQALGALISVPGSLAEGKGEIALDNANAPDAQRAQNRRAEVTLSFVPKAPPTPGRKPVVSGDAGSELPAHPKIAPPKEPILSDDQKVGDKITLQNILFAGGRHVLLPESYETLEQLKNMLLEKKKYHILILGHICCISSGEDGMDFDTGKQNLSVARARAVYNYLVENGVGAERLSYKGMRAKYPTGKSDREDRRVEIEITKVSED